MHLDTTASEICQLAPSNETRSEAGAEPVTQIPKLSLNLAGLKAAFSSHHCSNSGNKLSEAKAANSGPTQKALQSFFKGPAKPTNSTQSVKSPLKPTRDLVKCSAVGRSVLDEFRYRTTFSDTDSEKDGTLSSCGVTMAKPDIQHSRLEFSCPELVTDRPIVKDEAFEETSDSSHTVPEEAELKTEPCPSNEDCIVSPDAKRARTEKPHFPTKHKSNTISSHLEKSSLTVDAPVRLQRTTVPLQFSFQELAGKIKRLKDQQTQRASELLRYRRFRAKINPGENQSAEEELKKEIRWDFASAADCTC